MSRANVKVKKVKVPLGSQDKDLVTLFNKMLSTDELNLDITYPRYKRIKATCENLLMVLEILFTFDVLKVEGLIGPMNEIRAFHDRCKQEFAELFSTDWTQWEWDLTLVEDSARKKFADKYCRIKQSNNILEFVKTRHILIDYRASLSNIQALKPYFITSMSGFWYPFSFSKLDIVDTFVRIQSVQIQNIFLLAMHKILTLSDTLFNELHSPDVDISAFIVNIMSNIDNVQKIPELSRCHQAFKKIKDSVSMLQDNFNTYYRSYVATGSASTIMECFVADVSLNTKTDAKTTMQFQQIIKYHRNLAAQQPANMNPQVKSVLEKINSVFSRLDCDGKEKIKIDDPDNGAGDMGPGIPSGPVSINDIADDDSSDEEII